MVIVAIVFIGVLAIVLGAYWALVVRGERELLQRVAAVTPASRTRTPTRGMLKAVDEATSDGRIHCLIDRAGPAGVNFRKMVEQSGVRLSPGALLLFMAFGALTAFFVALLATRDTVVAVGAAIIAGALPYAFVRRARTKRMRKFERHFPEAIDLIARALRAGHALPTGLGMVADEMPAPVGTEFRLLYEEQNFGLTIGDALRNFADRIPVLDARFFVTAVLTQREVGGNLAEVLDNLASVIRERFKIKRQVRVISAHGRITGWVLALLPPSLAAVTLLFAPKHLGTLIGDPLGRQMIVVALLLQLGGTLVIRKIVNVEY